MPLPAPARTARPRLAFLLLAAALTVLAGCSKSPVNASASSSATPARTEIRFAHAHSPDLGGELHYTAATFAEALATLSDHLPVKIFPQASLGSEREVYEGLQLGSGASMTVSGTGILGNFDQRIGLVDLPYLFKDYDHLHRALDGEVGRELAAGLEKQGIVVLAWVDSWGFRNLVTSKKIIERPDDLSGLKIRTIPAPTYLAALRMMGANPTPMTWGETYTGLQTGVIDGFEQAPAILVAERFYEVAKHVTKSRHIFPALVVCYSKAHWDRLSPDDQAQIRHAAQIARDKGRALAPIREAEAFKILEAHGMTIHDVDTTEWQKAAIKLQDDYAAEHDATALLAKIRAAANQ